VWIREERDPDPLMGPAVRNRGDRGGGWRRIATHSCLATLMRLLGAALYRDLPRRQRKPPSLLTSLVFCGAEGRTFESCRARQIPSFSPR
jgi:hypothetical protein